MWARGGLCFITHSLDQLRSTVEQLADRQIGRIYLSGGDGSVFLLLTIVEKIYYSKGLLLPEIAILGGGTAEDTLNWLPGAYKKGKLVKNMKFIMNNLNQKLVAVSHLKTIRVNMGYQEAFSSLLGEGDHEYLTTAFGTGTIADFLRLYNQIPNKAVKHVWTIFWKAALSAIAPISLQVSLEELEQIRKDLENGQIEALKIRYQKRFIGRLFSLYSKIPGQWLKKRVAMPWLLKLLAAQKYFILFKRHRELVTIDDHNQRNVGLRCVMAGVPGCYSKLGGIRKHFFKLFPKTHMLEEKKGFNVVFVDGSLFNTFMKFFVHFLFRIRPGNRYFIQEKLLLEGVDGQNLVATLNGETFVSDHFHLTPGPTFRIISPVGPRSKVKLNLLQEYYISK
jgi:hypothetical protein